LCTQAVDYGDQPLETPGEEVIDADGLPESAPDGIGEDTEVTDVAAAAELADAGGDADLADAGPPQVCYRICMSPFGSEKTGFSKVGYG
jgi:hypothetical protein